MKVLRVVLAVLAAAVLCRFVAYPDQHPLRAVTDVIGYPLFNAWNPGWYQALYRRWIVVFPVVALAVYFILGRLTVFAASRSSGLAPSPPSTGTFFRAASAAPSDFAALAMHGRIVLTGLAVGLEMAVITDTGSVGTPLMLGVVVMGVLAFSCAYGAYRANVNWSWLDCLAGSSSIAVAVPISRPALIGVSRSTVLTVISTGERVSMDWLPAVVALAGVLGVLLYQFFVLRSQWSTSESTGRIFRLERTSVLSVSGAVLAFLLTAALPGEVGPLDAFHEGESLAAVTSLRFDEWPWQGSLGIHGLLLDYVQPLVGLEVFGDSRWASVAGQEMLLIPLCAVTSWWLWVRFTGRAWPVLVVAGLLVTVGSSYPWLVGAIFGSPHVPAPDRAPARLATLVAALGRRSTAWAVVTGTLLAVQFILTPESAYLVVGVFAAVGCSELYERASRRDARIKIPPQHRGSPAAHSW